MVTKVSQPLVIPAGDGKLIEEFIGRAHTGATSMSVAHMIAPPGWSEPFQQPEFDEATIVLRGSLRVEHAEFITDVTAGEVVFVSAGERIRYSNPFEEEAEYWAVCSPAFSPDTVHREPG